MINRLKWVLAGVAMIIQVTAATGASTDWEDLGGGKARVVAELDPRIGEVRGAVEVVLKPGWSTYWRSPGSSGIPPVFNFGRSRGFLAQPPEFPAPQLLGEGDLHYAGYKGTVRFPFSGRLDPKPDSTLHLDLLIGVCETICIPATAQFMLESVAFRLSDPLASQVAQVARESLPAPIDGKEIMLEKTVADRQTLHVTLSRIGQFKRPDLFVEGPMEWYLTPARRVKESSDAFTFAIDVSQVPDGVDVLSKPLAYTLTENGKGVAFRD